MPDNHAHFDFSKPYLVYTDDDLDDLFIFNQALNDIDPEMQIKEFRNGSDTISFLEEAKKDGHFPCLIILDLNMPGMNGKETVIALKSDEQFDQIPVVVFTTSSSTVDLEFCAQYNVECIIKPTHFSDLVETIRRLIGICDQ